MGEQLVKSLFTSDIYRQIEEVIKGDQAKEEILHEEISEYVVTDAIRRYFLDILDRYYETPNKPHEGVAVWGSGFFGSGKSSFAKILGVALANRKILDDHSAEFLLAERCKELMDRRHPNKNLVFVIDEVGQFVARDVQKMLDLRAVVQSLGRVGRGKMWIVVTSQEKLNELVGGLDDKRVELARLMDSFPLQVHLEPSDISEVTSKRVLSKDSYPIQIKFDGILVDDRGDEADLAINLEKILQQIGFNSNSFLLKLNDKNDELDLWLKHKFFNRHIRTYSVGRRKAPIYWQLSTPSASYSVWLYYHRFTKDTFYKVLNDYVIPKLQQEYCPKATAKQRKEIATQESFVEELRTFKQEVTLIAPLWNPNLNDGVIINSAPLWRLVPHLKSWRKECKTVWDKLVKGEFDWAHLSMHLWPERVVPKCQKDRSLAIAHDLEETLWYEADDGKWYVRDVAKSQIDELIQERTSTSVKAALDDLLSAPTTSVTSKKRRT